MNGTESPLVSVLMPTHNYARYLPEAIASLQGQSFHDWECLVVDDGSQDETPQLLVRLAEGDPRIITMRQEQRGPAVARNRAIEMARGRYVQFLDADDVLPPGKLADHVRVLEADPSIDIVYGPTVYFDDGAPQGRVRLSMRVDDRPAPPRLDGSGSEVVDVLLRNNVITIEAPLTRRAVFDHVGRFDEHLPRITDWQFWLRCALAGKRFAFVDADDPVAFIRLHGSSLSHRELEMWLAEIEMRQRLEPVLPEGTARDMNACILSNLKASSGIALGLRGDTWEGLRLLVPAAIDQRKASLFRWSIALLGTPIPAVRRRLLQHRAATPGRNLPDGL